MILIIMINNNKTGGIAFIITFMVPIVIRGHDGVSAYNMEISKLDEDDSKRKNKAATTIQAVFKGYTTRKMIVS